MVFIKPEEKEYAGSFYIKEPLFFYYLYGHSKWEILKLIGKHSSSCMKMAEGITFFNGIQCTVSLVCARVCVCLLIYVHLVRGSAKKAPPFQRASSR